MTRLFVLLLCLYSVAGFGQRRAVVREPTMEMVRSHPKVQRSSMNGYGLDTNVHKSYTSWASLAQLSRETNRPSSLLLVLDLAG